MTDEQLFHLVRTSGCRESLEELKVRHLEKTSRYLASFETGADVSNMFEEVFSRILKGRYPQGWRIKTWRYVGL